MSYEWRKASSLCLVNLFTSTEKSALVLLEHGGHIKGAAHQVKPITVLSCKDDVLMGLFRQMTWLLSVPGDAGWYSDRIFTRPEFHNIIC